MPTREEQELSFYKASCENLLSSKKELEARVQKLERENELLQDALDEVVGLRPKVKVLRKCLDIYHQALWATAWNYPLTTAIAQERAKEALAEVKELQRSNALERLMSLPAFPDSVLAASELPRDGEDEEDEEGSK